MKKILKRRYLLILILFILSGFASTIFAQSQQANLERYWRYRERLRDKFMAISDTVEDMGVNLPGMYMFNNGNNINFGDNNLRSGLYISMLSTELWVLKKNNQDYSETLKELYYAMLAIERLDLYSEAWDRYILENSWSDPDSFDFTGFVTSDLRSEDINGYYTRDDFSREFESKYSNQFEATSFLSVFKHDRALLQGISQDNIFNMLQSLSILEALVGTENVSNIPAVFTTNHIPNYLSNKNIKNGNLINFGQWAKDLTLRYTNYIQADSARNKPDYEGRWFSSVIETDWYIENSRGDLVVEGDGAYELEAWFNFGVIATAMEITDLPEDSVRKNDPYSYYLFDYFKETFADGGYPLLGVIDDTLAQVENLVWKLPQEMVDFWYPEPAHKTRFLGTLGDICNSLNTLSYLRNLRDNSDYPLEHFPLIYMCVHRDKYPNINAFYTYGSQDFIDEMKYYTDLLDLAPPCGPHNDTSRLDYSYEWSAASRDKPWNRGYNDENDDQIYEYSGLDYMLLHNLLYIAFLEQDFHKTIITGEVKDEWFPYSGHDIIMECDVINADVDVTARNSIILDEGFSVDGNATFKAEVIPITSYYNAREFKFLNVTCCE